MTWLLLGLIGWICLMAYRIITEGLPKKGEISRNAYIRGFIFSLILGPLCFAFLVFLIIDGRRND